MKINKKSSSWHNVAKWSPSATTPWTLTLQYPLINYPATDIVVDDFSQLSTQMERKIYKILIRTFGVKNYGQKCTICIMNLAQGIIEENKSVDVSAFDNFEVRTLKTYMKIMQEAYVKRVIEVFHLRPEDLNITPEYFCEIGFCNWQSLKVAFIQKILMRSSNLQTKLFS